MAQKHIVITGLIGSGKSFYAQKRVVELEEQGLSALNLDYDELAHIALERVHGVSDSSARKELAAKIFSDKSAKSAENARTKLENELHPLVYVLAEERAKASNADVVLHQIPLYDKTQAMFAEKFGKPTEIIRTEAPLLVIRERLKASRKMTDAEIDARLSVQVAHN